MLGLACFAVLLGYLAWAAAAPAYQADTLAAGFSRWGRLDAAGVEESELSLIAEGIAGYLRGGRTSPQVEVTRRGRLQPAFSQREVDHMPDVKRLTDGARGVWRAGIAAAALLAGAAVYAARTKNTRFPRLMGRSLMAAGAVLTFLTAALAAWALLDFTGLFYRLHQWLFPNDFWLLDPQEHLMIQLMPEPFFVDYALNALKRAAWLLLTFPAAWLMMRRPCRKRAA